MENAIENGIRLDWFLAKGFKLAVGDNACFDSFEFKGIITIILPDEWNEPCDDDNKRFIKSFALRPVNSENPIPDGAPTTHTLIDNVMHWSFDFDALLKMYKEEKPEEKEAMDTIEQTEWVNGDECISSTGHCYTFIGKCDESGFDCILLSDKGIPTFGFIKELSKPETPEQKLEREREAAAIELHDLFNYTYYDGDMDGISNTEWHRAPEQLKKCYLAMVDKTGYRVIVKGSN